MEKVESACSAAVRFDSFHKGADVVITKSTLHDTSFSLVWARCRFASNIFILVRASTAQVVLSENQSCKTFQCSCVACA